MGIQIGNDRLRGIQFGSEIVGGIRYAIDPDVVVAPTSFFDAAVVGGDTDPNISDATPGCLLTFASGDANNSPINGTDSDRRPSIRIPPSYVVGGVTAYWALLDIVTGGGAIHIRTATINTSDGFSAGPELTDVGESTIGFALRAPDGSVISFLLSVLNDPTEPYLRVPDNGDGSDDPAFDTVPVSTFTGDEWIACADGFAAAVGGQVVIVDTSDPNVDWDNLEFAEAGTPETSDLIYSGHQHISLFASGIVGGDTDPNVSGATPGCLLTHTAGSASRRPVDGSSATRRPAIRIPPPYVTGAADAFWAIVAADHAAGNVGLSTSLASTDNGLAVGPELTDTAESTLGIAMRAPDGSEISFLLSDLNDPIEPYGRSGTQDPFNNPTVLYWNSPPLSTFTGAEFIAVSQGNSAAAGGQVVIVDTSNINVDWPNLEFRYA